MKTANKYNVKEIMVTAHNLRRAENLSMGDALKAAWSVAKIKIGVSPLDATAQELFLVRAQKAELEAREKVLEMKLKEQCKASPDGKISGYGWTASLTTYTRNQLDTKTFKADHADLYAEYSRPQTVTRFNFGSVAV